MASSQTSEALLAGKYRLEEPIGSGGMGTVYSATHLVLHRPVAVKLMNVTGSDPLLGERFLREARVAAAVRHPNVVDIIDFGTTTTGQPFMVMELLEGQSLWSRMVASPPLTTEESVSLIAQVLLGVDAVHRAGIIHRDLKPANIFVSPHDDGSTFARLLDFGISYSIDPESQLRRGQFGTDERLIVGTPEYISPEQAEGRPDVDVRGDVYAMGVILYELLTDGQLPYSDPNPGGVLFKVMSGGHVPLAKLRPDIPEIAAVVDLALSHDRDARPPTARELRRQLLSASGLSADLSGTFARLSDAGGRRPTPRGVFSTEGRKRSSGEQTLSKMKENAPTPASPSPSSPEPASERAASELAASAPSTPAPSGSIEAPRRPVARWSIVAVVVLALGATATWLFARPDEQALQARVPEESVVPATPLPEVREVVEPIPSPSLEHPAPVETPPEPVAVSRHHPTPEATTPERTPETPETTPETRPGTRPRGGGIVRELDF